MFTYNEEIKLPLERDGNKCGQILVQMIPPEEAPEEKVDYTDDSGKLSKSEQMEEENGQNPNAGDFQGQQPGAVFMTDPRFESMMAMQQMQMQQHMMMMQMQQQQQMNFNMMMMQQHDTSEMEFDEDEYKKQVKKKNKKKKKKEKSDDESEGSEEYWKQKKKSKIDLEFKKKVDYDVSEGEDKWKLVDSSQMIMGGARKLTLSFKGKDQGWGNQKGQVALSVDKRDPDTDFKSIGEYEGFEYKGMKGVWFSEVLDHDWVDVKETFSKDSVLIQAMDDDDED